MKILKIAVFTLLMANLVCFGAIVYDILYFSGIRYKYYYDNNLLMETPYHKGAKDGIEIEYHTNGAIKRETAYKNGKKDGVERKYYFYEDIESEATYENGKCVGYDRIYHENGFLKREVNCLPNGKATVEFYDANGSARK